MHTPTNDNDGAVEISEARQDCAQGRAAYLLVESLIHGLLAKSVITVGDAVEMVEVATDVHRDLAIDRGGVDRDGHIVLQMLDRIAQSLRMDLRPIDA